MNIEFVPDGTHDCPAILFYDCPSDGANSLINIFRSLAEKKDMQVELGKLAGVTLVGNLKLFATNSKGDVGVERVSTAVFRWCRDREGWLEATELAEPVAHSEPSEGTRFQYLERNGEVNVIFSTGREW